MRQHGIRQKRIEKVTWWKPLMAMFMLAVTLLVSTAVTGVDVLADEVTEGEKVAVEENPTVIYYTALGDSIPNGYQNEEEEGELISYPTLVAEDLREMSKLSVELSNHARNGLTTTKLNSKVLADPEVQAHLAQADIVTVTIGANDLMNQFKRAAQEILGNEEKFFTVDAAIRGLQNGIADNPLLLINVATAISNWDYTAFEEQWVLAMETIHTYAKEDAQVVVTTIYNPLENRELPGTLNAVASSVIGSMNDIIIAHAEGESYQVADLYESGIEDNTQIDGLHPNQEGNELIAQFVEAHLDTEEWTGPVIDEEAQKKAQEAADKAAAAKKARQQRNRRNLAIRIIIIVVLLLVAILVIRRIRRKNQRSS